jgi:hypothetical protein
MQINEKAIHQSISIPAKNLLKEQSTAKTITQTPTPLDRKLIDLLFIRFEAIYGHLWTSRHTDAKAWQITKDEWRYGLANIDLECIRRCLDDLRTNGDQFPPTLPAFVKMCLSKSGIPSEYEAYQMAIRRKFDHPLAESCYKKIGSWDFTHDTDKVLRKKFAIIYKEILKEFTLNQKLLS